MVIQKPKNTRRSIHITRLIFPVSDPLVSSTRNQQIQAEMTYRALELLNLPPTEPAFLLDIGCGSGLSGEILDEEGYIWAGVDIAPSMLGMLMRLRTSYLGLI
jgi:2-polyprenyl-3-methyl-5-hydroxy-6-metoxy-1,4-benzoquinol methylase